MGGKISRLLCEEHAHTETAVVDRYLVPYSTEFIFSCYFFFLQLNLGPGGRIIAVDPFRAPEPLPLLNPSNFVPKNGFPVVKGLRAAGARSESLGFVRNIKRNYIRG